MTVFFWHKPMPIQQYTVLSRQKNKNNSKIIPPPPNPSLSSLSCFFYIYFIYIYVVVFNPQLKAFFSGNINRSRCEKYRAFTGLLAANELLFLKINFFLNNNKAVEMGIKRFCLPTFSQSCWSDRIACLY